MQGLVNFASQIGLAFAIVIQPICYLGALALFLKGGWGLWRMAQPDNPYRGRPWVPFMSILIAGVLASFDRILTKANVSAGSTVVIKMSPLASYTPVGPGSATVLGADPGTTIVNVVELFQLFFQAFGALACLFAVLSWHASITQRSNRSGSSCGVQFLFGVALINVLSVSQWVVNTFKV